MYDKEQQLGDKVKKGMHKAGKTAEQDYDRCNWDTSCMSCRQVTPLYISHSVYLHTMFVHTVWLG